MRMILCLSGAALLAACASTPRIAVNQSGNVPERAAFTLGAEANPAAAAYEKAMLAGLETRGFTQSRDGHYLVQFADSARPARTGIFLPESAPAADGEQDWLSAPGGGGKKLVRRVFLSFTDRASGQEVYRVTGTETFKPKRDAGEDALMKAVLASLDPAERP